MSISLADQRIWVVIELNVIRWLLEHNALARNLDTLTAIQIRMTNLVLVEALAGEPMKLYNAVSSQLAALMSQLSGQPASDHYRPLLAAPDDASGIA